MQRSNRIDGGNTNRSILNTRKRRKETMIYNVTSNWVHFVIASYLKLIIILMITIPIFHYMTLYLVWTSVTNYFKWISDTNIHSQKEKKKQQIQTVSKLFIYFCTLNLAPPLLFPFSHLHLRPCELHISICELKTLARILILMIKSIFGSQRKRKNNDYLETRKNLMCSHTTSLSGFGAW